MKPKEKAIDLTQRFLSIQELVEWGNDDLKEETELIYSQNEIEFDNYYQGLAKQSALISVTEILNMLNPTSIEYEYWEEVEFEINKL